MIVDCICICNWIVFVIELSVEGNLNDWPATGWNHVMFLIFLLHFLIASQTYYWVIANQLLS